MHVETSKHGLAHALMAFGYLIRNPHLTQIICAAQKFAAAYAKTVFLKFYGNHSEGTKHLFETRLQTPMTPTFTFWRQGDPLEAPVSHARICMRSLEALNQCVLLCSAW